MHFLDFPGVDTGLKKVKTNIKPLLLGKTLLWNPSPYLTIRALLFNFSVISTVDMTTSNLPLNLNGKRQVDFGGEE